MPEAWEDKKKNTMLLKASAQNMHIVPSPHILSVCQSDGQAQIQGAESYTQLWGSSCQVTWQRQWVCVEHRKNRTNKSIYLSSVQFSSVAQLCLTLCDPVDCSTPGLLVHHQPTEFTQTHVHRVSDAIQPSHPLSFPSPPAFNLSQNQGLFQWVSSSHQVAKVLEFQLQHQSFQWIFGTDFL